MGSQFIFKGRNLLEVVGQWQVQSSGACNPICRGEETRGLGKEVMILVFFCLMSAPWLVLLRSKSTYYEKLVLKYSQILI